MSHFESRTGRALPRKSLQTARDFSLLPFENPICFLDRLADNVFETKLLHLGQKQKLADTVALFRCQTGALR